MTENGFGNVLSNPSDLIGQFDADALVLVKMIFHGRLIGCALYNMWPKKCERKTRIYFTSAPNIGCANVHLPR